MKVKPYLCMVCKTIVISEPHNVNCIGRLIYMFQAPIREEELKQIESYNEFMEIYS